MAQLPADWDRIAWGWNFDALLRIDLLPGVSHGDLRCDQRQMRRNIESFQHLETSPVAARMLHGWGTLCYTISPKGAQALLDFCLPLRPILIDIPGFEGRFQAKSIDAALNAVHPSLKSFVCVPPLVITENRHETSTIVERT
jgi:hypothetical protein